MYIDIEAIITILGILFIGSLVYAKEWGVLLGILAGGLLVAGIIVMTQFLPTAVWLTVMGILFVVFCMFSNKK